MLHHVEIYVADLERSLAFWKPFLEQQLGYHESARWDEGASYRSGETYLCFVQTPTQHLAAGYHRQRVGLNHLAFHGRSREHVDAVYAWLKARGTPVLYDDRYPFASGPGYYALYCEDPDRIKVEVVAPP